MYPSDIKLVKVESNINNASNSRAIGIAAEKDKQIYRRSLLNLLFKFNSAVVNKT